jgi:uncharacterized protein involved in outer membrane biogenesis
MNPSTRKKLYIGGGGFVGLVIVALLVAPSFFDLNKYKPELAAQVKKATGRDLVVDGSVSLSLLPVPTVSASGVKFFNMPGSKNPNMVEIKSVSVRPSLLALLGGNIEVSEVTLVEPKIVLEINAQGKPNWEFAPSVAEAKPAAPKPSSPKPLSLGRLNIENGTLIFSDSKAGLSVVAEKANFSASVASLDGPYSLAGGATINGSPLKIDLNVSAKGTDGHAADLSLEAGGGKLGFKGTLSELGPNARIGGVATASAESLTGFIAALVKIAGQPEPALPPLLAGKFTFDGSIDVSQTSFAAKDFKMNLAGDSSSGSLSVTLKPALAVEGRLVIPKLDLDRALATLSQPAPAPAKPGSATAPAPPTATSGGASVLAGVTAKIALEAGEVIYNKTAIRNVALELEARGGAVAVPKLSATLPGDMVLQARSTMSGDPAKPTVSGDFSLVGPKLRETLKWLEVDTSAMPANKFNRLSLKGRMASSGGNVQVSDAVFELDELKGTGGVTVSFSVPLSVVAHVELDTLDVDPFLAAKPAGGSAPAKPAAAPAAAGKPAPAGPTIGFKGKVNKLIYNKETIGGVEVDVALQGSALKLNDIKIANLAGARLAVRGTVANYSSATPHPDIAFNFEAPDMGRVLKLVGGTAPAGLGQVNASGGVAGTIEQLTLRDLSVSAMGYNVKANGTLGLPGAARGTPQAVAYKGSVTVNGQTLEGVVDAKLSGKPTINADLKSATLDIDKLSGSGGGAPAPRGRPAPAAASTPIDTSALRSVDASLKLVAGTLISSSLHIGNADLAVTLKDGVLTLGHLTGSLYGGSLQLAGVVDGSKPALSVDLKGNAENILVGEMLRQTSGTNQFGGGVKVTIDGKLNARNIAIKGAGSTSEQLKSSMAGGADLSGHIFAGADKALTAIGSAATGAVGGVIDNTLGQALGIVGQKGGVGVGNLLNAISLVLNRFVNHDSPISGHVDIAGGVLSDRSLVVQGNRATANVLTRTNLVASTTDTTINFTIAEDPSAPYLISTIRGPTSNLSYNVVRGTAKDPPGMVNTLTNTITGGGGTQPQQQQQQRSLIPGLPIPNLFGR